MIDPKGITLLREDRKVSLRADDDDDDDDAEAAEQQVSWISIPGFQHRIPPREGVYLTEFWVHKLGLFSS